MGRRWKKFSLVLYLAGITFVLYAQPSELPRKNIIFEQLPEKLGLSQSSINCILQDRDGFLWVGTWSGLIRYDGYSNTVFHSDNASDKIKSNKIATIYEDRKGNIWVGTQQGGLFRYDKNTNKFDHFKTSDDENSLSDNNIWAIQEDMEGVLWIGTERGLNRWNENKNTFKRFFNVDGDSLSLSQDIVTDLFLSSAGDLWIGTAYGLNQLVTSRVGDSLVYTFVNHLYVPEPIDYSYPHYVYQINETKGKDGKPVIWFTTQRGLRKLENGRVENFLTNDKTSGFNLFRSFVVIPGDQPYLVVGSEMGLNFFDPVQNKFTRFLGYYDQNINLSHNTITSLYLDRGGVLWVGTKKGLNKFDSYNKNFQSHKTAEFDPTRSIITGIRNTLDGGYWISTIGGGLFKFNGKSFQRFQIKGQEKNDFTDFIQTLYTDTRGNVWIGTAGAGLYRFNEKQLSKGSSVITQFDHFTSNSSRPLSDSYIMSIVEDVAGNIWIGTWSGGLNRISPEGMVQQFTDPLLRQVPLVVMHADHAGVLWVGTRGHGLYRIKPRDTTMDIKPYQVDDSKNSLTNNFVNSIYEDHAGGLWIGTEGGLNSFDRRSESFKTHTLADGPSNDVIVSILEDDFGKLWLAHWDGLSVIDPANPAFAKNYDSHDRIQGGFFYSNVCFKDQQGHLLFGGSEGFNSIDPSAVVSNPLKATVVIQNFQIFSKPVSYGEEVDGRVILDKPLSEIKNVVLKHFENSVSIEYALLDYAAPEKIRYAYRLEGFDPEWNYTTASRRYANYTNLGPGEYTFKVRATNNDGEWNEQVSQLKLVIRPPWWKTVWAGIFYFVASVLVLHVFRRFVLMRANFIHDLKLERIQRENMEKLNRAKLQFFTNISHEFRTPLTLILGPVHTLLESGEGGKFIREQIVSINNNAQRLLRLVNQLLDFRKAESGNLKLEVSEGNLARFVKEVKLSFDALASQLNIDFSFHSSSNVIQAWFDRDQFEKILFNLLSNAFKHTPEGGKISIQVIEEKDKISIVVEDNGTGIKQEHFDSIFQTFFSYDEGHHQTGTGIGLALAKSLVDAHHGTIDVESMEHQFTRFTVRIWKGSDHFHESELLKESTDQDHIEKYPTISPEVVNGHGKIQEQSIPNLEELPKLLVVEDNAEVRSYIKSIFLGTYIVFEAENGKEGLDVALEEMPDLIISDVMMPLMDGITLCKRLKTSIKTSHIPVVLLTARTSLIFKVEGLETGADDYVTKPFNPKVLQLKVRNLIRTRESMHKTFRDNEVLSIEPKRVTLTSADETFVEQMLASIEKNMSNADYSVEDLGVEVGMSRTQLYRKLKALTGQSANEFIRTIRLKRAAQLLEQSQLTIAEVTYEVGFSDLQYFRECFKKLFGLTPSEYSQKATGKQVVE